MLKYSIGSHELRVDSWRNELVVRQSPGGKDVSVEAEDIVGMLAENNL
jgi:hypothetical protein